MGAKQLEIWLWKARRPAAENYRNFLSIEEIERTKKLSPDRALEFGEGRMALRSVLSKRLEIPPPELPIVLNSMGKPHLKNIELHFSLAHSGEYFGLAVYDREIGFDIERIDSERELSGVSLKAFGDVRDPEVFYSAWVQLEAHAKCLGISVLRLMPYQNSLPYDGRSQMTNDLKFMPIQARPGLVSGAVFRSGAKESFPLLSQGECPFEPG